MLSLEDCLRIAMEKNRQRPASRFAVAMAEAQHRQALAGYWPQISAKGGWTQLDQAPNFIFPASMMYIPSQTVNVPGGTTSAHPAARMALRCAIPPERVGGGPLADRSGSIRVRIRRLGESRISLSVQDTGVGLAPENLTRVFKHGFTSKTDGHGFGLHSCALAASRMGGSLRAESEGIGRGATLIPELPLRSGEEMEENLT
jgi:hypothetical protein